MLLGGVGMEQEKLLNERSSQLVKACAYVMNRNEKEIIEKALYLYIEHLSPEEKDLVKRTIKVYNSFK